MRRVLLLRIMHNVATGEWLFIVEHVGEQPYRIGFRDFEGMIAYLHAVVEEEKGERDSSGYELSPEDSAAFE